MAGHRDLATFGAGCVASNLTEPNAGIVCRAWHGSIFPAGRAALLALLVAIGVVLQLAGGALAQSRDTYNLGVGDKVRLKMGQWRAVEGIYENWGGVEGEYVVGPDGMLAIPLAGLVPAGGRTVAEIADDVSLRVQQRVGLPTPPSTSIEVAEFRPIYVVGAVMAPGEFKFRPQMTVMQAVGLAGGFMRTANTLRDALGTSGEYDVLQLTRWSLLARLARLETELANGDTIAMPSELAVAPNAEELMRVEHDILAARNEDLHSKQAAIADLKKVLSARIEKLNEERKLRTEQLKLAREELKRVQGLVERGLTVSSRGTEFSGTVSDMEAQLLSLEVATLTAEQQFSEAVRDELSVVNERRQQIVMQVRDTQAELDSNRSKLQTTRAILAEAGTPASGQSQPDPSRAIFRLTHRAEDGKVATALVDGQRELNPGDMLEVAMPEPSSVDVPVGTTAPSLQATVPTAPTAPTKASP